MFYLAAGALLLSAIVVMIWALLRPVGSLAKSAVRQETVRALYQDRLEELGLEASAGQVATEDRAEMEAELGSVLLADYEDQADPAAAAVDGKNRKLLLVLPALSASPPSISTHSPISYRSGPDSTLALSETGILSPAWQRTAPFRFST